MEISIKPEEVFEIFNLPVTNSLLLSGIVFLFFTFIAVTYYRYSFWKRKNSFYYFITFILRSLYQLFHSVLREHTDYFFPLLAAFFLYILFQNWFGLLPGVGSILINHVPLLRGNNADLNATLSLALLSVILTQVFGIKYLGLKEYLKKFFNFTNPIAFFTGILEVISEFSKIISFAFRLFGNIFAGEVLLTIMAFLIPVLVSFPFLLLEVFVGLIQALVFSMLTAVFLSLAIQKHH
jgi:F-type H+-transporting ATPase subunit a